MQNIIILEDIKETRELLSSILKEAFTDITIVEAATLKQARLQLKKKMTFNLALIDLHLSDGLGTDFLHEIKLISPETCCVIITIFDDDEHLFPALQAGADGYVVKGVAKEKLVHMMQGTLSGEPPISPSIARRMLKYFEKMKKEKASLTASKVREETGLTIREEEVLILVTKGMNRKKVASELKIKESTVAGYIKSIYQKLGISSRAEAAIEAGRMGLINAKPIH